MKSTIHRIFKRGNRPAADSGKPDIRQHASSSPTATVAFLWNRTRIKPENAVFFLDVASAEIKRRGVLEPLILLPFRPSYALRDAQQFIAHIFPNTDDMGFAVPAEDSDKYMQHQVQYENIFVLVSAIKWVWARLPGGVVKWEIYEVFKAAEEGTYFAFYHK